MHTVCVASGVFIHRSLHNVSAIYTQTALFIYDLIVLWEATCQVKDLAVHIAAYSLGNSWIIVLTFRDIDLQLSL